MSEDYGDLVLAQITASPSENAYNACGRGHVVGDAIGGVMIEGRATLISD